MPPNPPGEPQPPKEPQKTVEQVVEELGLYPREAFVFVMRGLSHTVEQLHGPKAEPTDPQASRHVTGQQLCEGLRDFALGQWGLLARTVLRRWGLTRTDDFGRIVFALVDSGIWARTEDDSPADFKNVFDFAAAFETGYRIELKA